MKARLRGLAERYRDDFDVDVEQIIGSGAAGGLGGGLVSLGATIVSGFELIAEELGLFEEIEQADLVITGEGQLDNASFDGKVVGGVAEMAAEVGARLVVVAGAIEDLSSLPIPENALVISLTERFGLEQAMAGPARCAQMVVDELLADDV